MSQAESVHTTSRRRFLADAEEVAHAVSGLEPSISDAVSLAEALKEVAMNLSARRNTLSYLAFELADKVDAVQAGWEKCHRLACSRGQEGGEG